MKALFILFDSLNRQALSCYNPSTQATPSFDRLAERGVVFDNHYVSSLPCMPARRDLLTGRLSFLHRSWGPVEPFDTCFTSMLKDKGIYSHLISDHYHYWEEGGCGYHNQYSSAEFVRGQERDLWKAMVQPPAERFRQRYHPMLSEAARRSPNMVNREFIQQESDFPIVQCVDLANDFLQQNHQADNWLLQVELFDPHEPFTAPERFRETLQTNYKGPILDWPLYDRLDLSEEEAAELRANYQAVVALCDDQLGRLLDQFDKYNLWEDTAIILTTDHGFLLGEQDWWGKNVMPVLDPIAHIPLIIYHPEAEEHGGQRRSMLTQCLDIPATLVDVFQPPDADRTRYAAGTSLLTSINEQRHVRDFALYGLFGGAINITDGRYTYFRYPVNTTDNLYEYTLMPAHPTGYFTQKEFRDAELITDNAFAQGYPVLKIKAHDDARRPPMQGGALADSRTVLYDLHNDPLQRKPLTDSRIESKMLSGLVEDMKSNSAPSELFARFDV